jgi:hypothetical protein
LTRVEEATLWADISTDFRGTAPEGNENAIVVASAKAPQRAFLSVFRGPETTLILFLSEEPLRKMTFAGRPLAEGF